MKNHIAFQDLSYYQPTSQYTFLIICVLPLFFIPYGFPDPFNFPKMVFWFISFFAILTVLFITKAKLHTPIFRKSNQTKDQRKILFFLLLYFLSWCISSFFSVDKSVSFSGIVTQNGMPQLILGVATFLLIANHYTFEIRHIAFAATTFSIIGLLAILQFYGLDPFQFIYGEHAKEFIGQAFATIGNQNQVATCLCVLYIITAFFFIISNQGQKGNRLLFMSVMIIFAGNIATNSKAGLIADGATMLVALPLIMKNRVFLKRYIQILTCSLILFIVMNLSSNSVVFNRLLQMLFEGFDMLHGNVNDEYGSSRIEIWINSINLIKHYWLVGSGPDTFKQIYDMSGFGETVLSPHNESLRLLITTGIASLIFYWMFVLSVMKNGFQKINEDKIIMPFILGLLCYEIKLMFNCSSINDIIIFWVLLAIIFNRTTSCNKMNSNPR